MSNEIQINSVPVQKAEPTDTNKLAVNKGDTEVKQKTPLLSFKTEKPLVELSKDNDSKKTEQVKDEGTEPIKKMKVKPGWGNQRIAIEVLKSYGIENPTEDQIKKVQMAIEDANADQVKVWKLDNNRNIPKGTKYFYANANLTIPDLYETLGIQNPEGVKEIKNQDDPIISIPLEDPKKIGLQPQPKEENGKGDCAISNPTHQSKKTNDCWLLSGTNALMTTDWGRELINEAIKKDENGNVTITLKGADNKQIQVSPEEIEQAKESGLYSNGDDNMIALEIAINKYKEEIKPRTDLEKEINGLAINWGEGYDLFHLLTGKNVLRSGALEVGYRHPEHVQKGLDVASALDTMRDNPNEVAMVVSFMSKGDPFSKFVVDGVELSPKHAYSVAGVEKGDDGKEYVVLVNPSNSGEQIRITRESFLDHLSAADAIANNDDSLKIEEYNKKLRDILKF